MPTISDNIEAMAALVARVKKDHRLTENTVMRIVDMNFALAQGAGMPSLSGDEQLPSFEEPDPTFQQMSMFPDEMPSDIAEAVSRWADEQATTEPETTEVNGIDEDEVLATTDHKELN